MKNGLIDKLEKAAGGFMTQLEAQTVGSKPNNAEQMGELIQILRGKGNADFHIFCSMLRQSNNDTWADELERKARNFKGETGTHVYLVERRTCTWSTTFNALILVQCLKSGNHTCQYEGPPALP